MHAGERDRLLDRARQQRQWAVTGVTKATKKPKDNDKVQRDFRVNRTEKQAAKVRSTEKALERLKDVEKPFEPWQLHLEMATAPRSGEVVARFKPQTTPGAAEVISVIESELGKK